MATLHEYSVNFYEHLGLFGDMQIAIETTDNSLELKSNSIPFAFQSYGLHFVCTLMEHVNFRPLTAFNIPCNNDPLLPTEPCYNTRPKA